MTHSSDLELQRKRYEEFLAGKEGDDIDAYTILNCPAAKQFGLEILDRHSKDSGKDVKYFVEEEYKRRLLMSVQRLFDILTGDDKSFSQLDSSRSATDIEDYITSGLKELNLTLVALAFGQDLSDTEILSKIQAGKRDLMLEMARRKYEAFFSQRLAGSAIGILNELDADLVIMQKGLKDLDRTGRASTNDVKNRIKKHSRFLFLLLAREHFNRLKKDCRSQTLGAIEQRKNTIYEAMSRADKSFKKLSPSRNDSNAKVRARIEQDVRRLCLLSAQDIYSYLCEVQKPSFCNVDNIKEEMFSLLDRAGETPEILDKDKTAVQIETFIDQKISEIKINEAKKQFAPKTLYTSINYKASLTP